MSVAPAAQATASIVICSLPRSGSWLLAKALESSGQAGHAQEYLRPELEQRYASMWGIATPTSVEEFTAAMLRCGTTANGVFALKVHWQDFARYLQRAREAGWAGSDPAVLASLLPQPRFVHIVRRDTLRQAISWCRALDSNAWWHVDGADDDAPDTWDPDFDKIDVLQGLLHDHEQAWRRFFAEAGVAPVEVVYEDLVADYDTTVRRVLDALGIALPATAIAPASLRRQADALSETWLRKHLQRRDAVALPPAKATTRALTAHNPWVRYERPFRHVVAHNVFRPDVYARLDTAFTGLLHRGAFDGTTGGFDALSHSFRQGTDGPFALFCSREWHDLLCRITGVQGTGHVFAGLHHHRIGSASGGVHNDLNPGYFPRPAAPDEVVLSDPTCDYNTGAGATNPAPARAPTTRCRRCAASR